MKRIVTAMAEDGRSVFGQETQVEPVVASMAPDLVNFPIFATLNPADVLGPAGAHSDEMPFFPPDGALRAFQLEIAPPGAPSGSAPTSEQVAEGERLFPGLFSHMEQDHPGMHQTLTVDFVVVLSGEVVLELDAGEERTLYPGDTVVQRGTRHRWRNETTEPLRLFVVMFGVGKR